MAAGVAPARAATYNVSTEPELQAAIAAVNAGGGSSTLEIADGIYTLSAMLPIRVPHVTVRSASGNREAVILQGDAMSDAASVKEIFWVDADYFTVEDLTMRRVGWHLVQIVGEDDADFATIRNCVFRDAYEQMVKITCDPGNTAVGSDGGLIEGCLFEYTAGIGPQYYIGGVDGHQASDWTIRGNTFRDIASPDTAVAGRGHTGGVIRNNMVYHRDNGDPYADVGLSLTYSPGTAVYNNSVYFANGFPWAIEYRFPETAGVIIRNNLTNKAIQARDGATGTVSDNATSAQSSWFVDAGSGDHHLVDIAATRSSVIDRGAAIADVTTDIDGQARPQGGAYDIGADEHSVGDTTPPAAPTGLAVE